MGKGTGMRGVGEREVRRIFPAIFVVLALSVAFHLVDTVSTLENALGDITGLSVAVVIMATVLDVALILLTVTCGWRLLRGDEPDNTDLVNRCKSLAIASMGTCVVNWIIDVLADKSAFDWSLVATLVTVSCGALFYRLSDRLERTSFWDGIKTTMDVTPREFVGEMLESLVLDANSGHLRAPFANEEPNVRIVTEDEYYEALPDGMARSVVRPMKTIRFSSCLRLQDSIYGYVNVPSEVQRICGYAGADDVGFSFEFSEGLLTLVLPASEEARAFVAELLSTPWSISTSLAVIPQLVIALLTYVSAWLRECEDSLVLLESKLGEDLYEMPKGFSDYVNFQRRELGVLYSFCKGAGDMLEDLAEVTDEWGMDDVSSECTVVARQIVRLASDADEIRDFAGEIRTEYQELIEVRQNNVISVLTIVTTVFTPLSLVAGWYGMNFVNMPELQLSNAYFILAALMIFFIACEFSIFKRRRWF